MEAQVKGRKAFVFWQHQQNLRVEDRTFTRKGQEVTEQVKVPEPLAEEFERHNGEVIPLRGWTECVVKDSETKEVIATARAHCIWDDPFSRAEGRRVSLEKVLQKLPKRDRAPLRAAFRREVVKQMWVPSHLVREVELFIKERLAREDRHNKGDFTREEMLYRLKHRHAQASRALTDEFKKLEKKHAG
jgi:hypothetical protein